MVQHIHALPAGFRLKEYIITETLGFGGFGITYAAVDRNLDKRVAIKEFLPSELAVRSEGSTVSVKSDRDEAGFKWGLDRFLGEAKVVAKFQHANIVQIYRFFESNGTGYIVMEYIDGKTLSAFLRESRSVTESKIRAWIWPIMAGLKIVHEAGYLHRDIKPQNIMICTDGKPVLLDFGSARCALGDKTRSLTSVMTPGYAPLEQYSSRGNQGPWTDIYALGAVMYFCIQGNKPTDVFDRISDDLIEPLDTGLDNSFSQNFLDGIMWALRMRDEERPRTIDQWLDHFDRPDFEPTIRMPSAEQIVQPIIIPPSPEAPIRAQPDQAQKSAELVEVRATENDSPREIGLESPVTIRSDSEAEYAESERVLGLQTGAVKHSQSWWVGLTSRRVQLIIGIVVVSGVLALGFHFSGDSTAIKNEVTTDSVDEQFKQGQMNENGWGRSRNKKEAARLYELAALRGHAEAQYRLALMYFDGEGVAQNFGEALKWFQQAAEQQYAEAQYQLGYMYYRGEGVTKNPTEAKNWFTRAAENGHAKAKLYLPE